MADSGIYLTTPGIDVYLTQTAAPLTVNCSAITNNTKYEIIPSIICVACFLFGILYCFMGYRFFSATMFLTGFIFGGLITYVIVESESSLELGPRIGIALAAALVIGLITVLVQYVGLFITGFMLGGLVIIAILVLVEQFYQSSTRWFVFGLLFGCGLLVALFTLYFQRSLTIIALSVMGAAAILCGVDYFVERFLMANYLWTPISVAGGLSPANVCWFSWLIFALWPAITVLGILIQWKVTGKGLDHNNKYVLQTKRRKRAPKSKTGQKTSRQQPSRLELEQSRYRRLYQIRRANGDIISQSYIRSINDRLHEDFSSQTQNTENSNIFIISRLGQE